MAGAKDYFRTVGQSSKQPPVKPDIRISHHHRRNGMPSNAVSKSPTNPKSKHSTNASILFKAKASKSNVDHKRVSKKKAARPLQEPQGEFSLALERSLDKTRIDIESVVKDALTETHTSFEARLRDSELNTKSLLNVVSLANAEFGTSLSDETLSIIAARPDGSKAEIQCSMRQRVAQFKEFTDSERAKLQVCWKQWNEIDKAIGVLGHGVLGNILLREPDDHQVAGGMTFRKAMELTDIEYSTTLDECNEEIDELGADLIVKLRNAEEKSRARDLKQRAKLMC